MQNILKTCEDLGKTMNEDITKEGVMFPNHLIWKETPKQTEKQAITR